MASEDIDLDFFERRASHQENPVLRENFVKAPFGWPGGKSESVKHIIPLLPIRDSFIDVCGGSATVLLARDESELEVFNDRFSGVTDFYRVIQNPKLREEFCERIQPFIHSREMFLWCKLTWQNDDDIVSRAAKWYYHVLTSFGSQGRNFGRSTSGTNVIAQKLSNRIPLIDKAAKRMTKVLVENQDMFQLLTDFDDENAVFYVDPPYVGTGSEQYDCLLKREDHFRLCKTIMDMKGFVALSGYENDIYDSDEFSWTERHDWTVNITTRAMAFTKENNLLGLEDQMQRQSQKEVLWIKEAG